jgi:hypothetical protein
MRQGGAQPRARLLRLLLVAATLLPATALGQAAEENVRESMRALVPAKGARVPDLGG